MSVTAYRLRRDGMELSLPIGVTVRSGDNKLLIGKGFRDWIEYFERYEVSEEEVEQARENGNLVEFKPPSATSDDLDEDEVEELKEENEKLRTLTNKYEEQIATYEARLEELEERVEKRVENSNQADLSAQEEEQQEEEEEQQEEEPEETEE